MYKVSHFLMFEYVVNFSIKFCKCNGLPIDISEHFLMIVHMHRTLGIVINSSCSGNCVWKTFSELFSTGRRNVFVKFCNYVV